MTKILRRVVDGGYYHVVQRGNNKNTVYHESEDFLRYLSTISRYLEKFEVQILHYCLMPNHIHLLMHTMIGADLSKFMHGLNISYARYYKQKYSHSGSLWETRFGHFQIETDEYLLECARYIERNPFVAGLVENTGDYPYSSYNFYAHGKPNGLITPSVGYMNCGRDNNERRTKYRAYVMEERAAAASQSAEEAVIYSGL